MISRQCPYCMEAIADDAKVCPHCQSAVLKPCPYCAESIAVMAKRCRFCGTDLQTGAAAQSKGAPARLSNRPLGEKREILPNVLLIFVTCGVWAWVWWYKIGDEINRHHSRSPLNPGMDLLLIFLTCGIWMPFMAYKYCKMIEEIQTEEGLPAKDQATLVAVLGFFLPIVAKIILQDELNKHWDLHRGV